MGFFRREFLCVRIKRHARFTYVFPLYQAMLQEDSAHKVFEFTLGQTCLALNITSKYKGCMVHKIKVENKLIFTASVSRFKNGESPHG